MKLEGTYTFDAPRKVVWDALFDPIVLAKVIPGCEKLEQIGENEYKGLLKIRVGPVQGKFQGKVTLLDIVEPDNYRLIVDGKGAPGFMKGEGVVRLETQGDSTVMHYDGEAQVGGRIANVGQRLMDSSAKSLTKQSLKALDKQIQARLQTKASTGDDGDKSIVETAAASAQQKQSPVEIPPLAAPSQTEFALGVAQDMLEDFVPLERRPALLAAGLGAIAFFLFLHWWANIVARRVVDEIWERR